MKYLIVPFLLLTACQFHPLYNSSVIQDVCVDPIPEASGYQLRQALQKHFPSTSKCQYTLKVSTPHMSMSDQSISNSDFITMQRVQSSASYKLLDTNKKVVLSNSTSAQGSSAVVTNPYSTVVSFENTQNNLIPILAEQIALHVTAHLDRKNQ